MSLRKKIISLSIATLGFLSAHFLGIPSVSSVYAQNVAGNGVIAQTSTTNMNTQTQATSNNAVSFEESIRQLADNFLKIAYVILWPLIFLSGIALDNTMVYGEIFHMDLPLRQFWNFCKNFANFGLGFMILVAIIQNIFSIGGYKKPLDTIKNAVIAGILIQMSWFLTAALIDISTVTTYAVGGMPMNILKTDTNIAKTKILQPNATLNLNSQKKIEAEDFRVSYQVQKHDGGYVYLSPCEIKESKSNQKYIVGTLYADEKFKNQGKLGTGINKDINACVKNGKTIIFFNEFPDIADQTGATYNTILSEILDVGQRTTWEECGYVVKVNGTGTNNICGTTAPTLVNSSHQKRADAIKNGAKPTKPNEGAGALRFESSISTSIGDIIKKSGSFVGPLATIYASLLNFSNLADTSENNSSTGKTTGILIIKTLIAAGLIFPLIALTVVLMVRIGFLRCIIAASPIIILLRVFKQDKILGGAADYISRSNILRTVFAPVFTVFALSLSLIFMTALMSTFNPKSEADTINRNEALASISVKMTKGASDTKYDTINIAGATIEYDKRLNESTGAAGDWFSWMIICFSGIGIMWFILFAAIDQSGVFAKSFGKKVQSFGENMLGTMPIVPIKGGVGIKTLSELTDKGDEILMNRWNNSDFVNMKEQNKTMEEIEKTLEGKTNDDEDQNKVKPEVYFSKGSMDIEKGLTAITGKEKNRDKSDIMSGLENNPQARASINSMETEEKEKFFQKTQMKQKDLDYIQKKTEITKDVNSAKDKGDLDEKLKKVDIKELPKEFTTTASVDGKSYEIKIEDNKLVPTEISK